MEIIFFINKNWSLKKIFNFPVITEMIDASINYFEKSKILFIVLSTNNEIIKFQIIPDSLDDFIEATCNLYTGKQIKIFVLNDS